MAFDRDALKTGIQVPTDCEIRVLERIHHMSENYGKNPAARVEAQRRLEDLKSADFYVRLSGAKCFLDPLKNGCAETPSGMRKPDKAAKELLILALEAAIENSGGKR